jgi:hypothetical protein
LAKTNSNSAITAVLSTALIVSHAAFGQDPTLKTPEEACREIAQEDPGPPHWVLSKTQGFPTPIGVITYSIDVDLAPTSDSAQQWEEYIEARREFCEWFEETKQRLEDEFSRASGDAKIKAAEALLRFVFEAQVKWEAIKMPTEGTWEGGYRDQFNLHSPYLAMTGGQTATIQVSLERDAPNALTGKLEGDAANGNMDFKIDLATPGGAPFITLAISGHWDGKVVGPVKWALADVILHGHTEEMDAGFGFPGFFSYFEFREERMTGEAFLVADINRIYRIAAISDTWQNRWEAPLRLALTNRDESLDLTELKHQYFRQYVATIDDVKLVQLSQQPNHAGRRNKAKETLQLLLTAEAVGQAAGVNPSVIEGAGLAHKDPASLYDKWYGFWFAEAMAHWRERIEAAAPGSEVRVDRLLGRFNFVLSTIMDPTLAALISETLIQDFELYYPSNLVDGVYKPYYEAALELWTGRVRTDSTRLADALAWADAQALLARAGFVSSGLIAELGLTTPPRAASILQEAAEGGG